MLLIPNTLCCSLYNRNCICAVTRFLSAKNYCQLLPTTAGKIRTEMRRCTQAQLHFRDDQQWALGISKISYCLAGLTKKKIWRYNNSPPYMTVRWPPQLTLPWNFLDYKNNHKYFGQMQHNHLFKEDSLSFVKSLHRFICEKKMSWCSPIGWKCADYYNTTL